MEYTIPRLMFPLAVTEIARARAARQPRCQPAPWAGLLRFAPLSAPGAAECLERALA